MGRSAKFQNKTTLTVSLDQKDKDRLQRIADFEGEGGTGDVVRRALLGYLEAYESRNGTQMQIKESGIGWLDLDLMPED